MSDLISRAKAIEWEQCMSPVYEYGDWHWQPLPEPYKGGDDA